MHHDGWLCVAVYLSCLSTTSDGVCAAMHCRCCIVKKDTTDRKTESAQLDKTHQAHGQTDMHTYARYTRTRMQSIDLLIGRQARAIHPSSYLQAVTHPPSTDQ